MRVRRLARTAFAAACAIAIAGTAWAQQLPTSTENVVILARERLILGNNARHTAGEIVLNDAGAEARLSMQFQQLSGALIAADAIRVRFGLRVGPQLWDVFTNAIDDPFGSTVISGTGPTAIAPQDFPILPFPTPVSVTPGAGLTDIRRTDGAVTLSPGSYGRIRVRRRGVIIFEDGSYEIEEIRAKLGASILFNGTTTLNVLGRARFGRRVVYGRNPDLPAFNPRCIELHSASNRILRFGGNTNVEGIFSAPEARVVLGAKGHFIVHAVGRDVRVGRDTILEPLPAPDTCP